MKFFNTVGPINPENHYYIPHRLNEPEIKLLTEQEKYYILHAPRQSGKTTSIQAFVKQLNEEGIYKALYVNIEAAQSARNNFIEGMLIILRQFKEEIENTFGNNDEGLEFFKTELNRITITGNELASFLRFWSQHSEKPLIIFIDEIDSLVGDTLISVLRQLRAGYTNRPKNFPQSACLVGVRDVRDYMIWSNAEQKTILGGSAFNIKAESLILPDFTPEQTRNLYLQHTQETGQQFTDEAIEYTFYLTQGQPWLVNALAYQACFKDVTDRTQTITKEVIERAKETLIIRRDTHIDVLIDRLQEPRVRAIIDSILYGNDAPEAFPIDDISYVKDLGLISRNSKTLEIANPIYQEIIPRELSYGTQLSITQQTAWYQNSNGSLNIVKLLEAFTQFYRENSAIWLEKFAYKEAGPHLLLMAFLQRIINGGGTIHREYALGRRRVDLLIGWPSYALRANALVATDGRPQQYIVIELKIWRSPETLPEGLQQTAEYMNISNATEGHLIIFDRRPNRSWDEKIYHHQEQVDHKVINVWGM